MRVKAGLWLVAAMLLAFGVIAGSSVWIVAATVLAFGLIVGSRLFVRLFLRRNHLQRLASQSPRPAN